jgi:hypothetical protein
MSAIVACTCRVLTSGATRPGRGEALDLVAARLAAQTPLADVLSSGPGKVDVLASRPERQEGSHYN